MDTLIWFKIVYLNHNTFQYESEEKQFKSYKDCLNYAYGRVTDGLQVEYITL